MTHLVLIVRKVGHKKNHTRIRKAAPVGTENWIYYTSCSEISPLIPPFFISIALQAASSVFAYLGLICCICCAVHLLSLNSQRLVESVSVDCVSGAPSGLLDRGHYGVKLLKWIIRPVWQKKLHNSALLYCKKDSRPIPLFTTIRS